jgi:cyclopropane-fatty-acyl-phospholipid synthase
VSSSAAPPGAPKAGASPEAIRAHYDVGDDFFRLWLDPEMVYSAALFSDDRDDDLAAAQERKLDHHIAAARAKGAARVLDVGCGWGALLRRLTAGAGAGVGEAIGLTLSASQAGWIREMHLPHIEVREENWRDHHPVAPYDAVISIGAFEHFAKPGLSSAERIAGYREFFGFCRDALKPGGRISLQTIAYAAPGMSLPAFVMERIFPETEPPLISEPVVAAEGLFELETLRNDRHHYDRTLRLWVRNLTARREEAVALVGEQTVREFLTYLKASAVAFRSGTLCLLRMGYLRRD